MNQTVGGAPYVGAAAGGLADSTAINPMCIKASDVKPASVGHILTELSQEQLTGLLTYLTSRLAAGVIARNRRIHRYAKIDKLISTWQKLSPEDSEREKIEDNTGRQSALPMNLPVLATSLNDMSSYFAEALAPISNPFFSADGDATVADLLKKFNRDAAARNYFGELNLTIRSLLKYNLGGFRLDWDDGTRYGRKEGQPGNHWKSLDLYNTFWDPSIRHPTDIAAKGEWGATAELVNRLEIIRRAIAGEWVGMDDLVSKGLETAGSAKYYKESAIEGGLGEEGLDSRTSNAGATSQVNWGSFGLGLASDLGPEVDGFEFVDMCCWLIPCQHGLLTTAEEEAVRAAGLNPDTYLELWRFKIVNDRLVDAEPVMDREAYIGGEKAELPFYLSYLTRDQLKEAQRSFMELMKGFQRFSSAMYNIYIAGMRKNVWGTQIYDPYAIDMSQLKNGEVVGRVPTKQPGRDVRTILQESTPNAGVENVLSAVDSSLNLKNQFFPSQALPSQVAGIDRAVKSQVHTVVQGATRSMRTLLRVLDSTLMLPSRMAGYRNLKLYDKEGIENLTDEDVAKLMGSGIESMEAERVSEILWQLLYAIIQNAEAMQVFDIPKIFAYLGRVGNLSVDLGTFIRRQEPVTPPTGTTQPPATA
jgi:hypothetical protein